VPPSFILLRQFGIAVVPLFSLFRFCISYSLNFILVDKYFAKRQQDQERFTMQIDKFLQKLLKTDHVAVFIDAKHLCVSSRGVKDDATSTITSYYGGKFQDENTKREFLQSIQG
jgi:GTP cyclohydrolase I